MSIHVSLKPRVSHSRRKRRQSTPNQVKASARKARNRQERPDERTKILRWQEGERIIAEQRLAKKQESERKESKFRERFPYSSRFY